MADFDRMKNDFDYFCEKIFGDKLQDWQKDIMHRLATNGTVATKMMVKDDLLGFSVDCIIMDDVYEKPAPEGSMLSDLVKRLRSPVNKFYEYNADNGAFLREAADRIEQLEALLEQRDGFIVSHGLWDDFINSLEEKK